LRSSFDAAAASFDRHRAVPETVAAAIRAAILAAIAGVVRPRVLDLGAGSGRFGWPFVAAGDDYVGVDLSAGMLRVFANRDVGNRPLLVQADGRTLPFAGGSFDALLLFSIFGDLPDWRRLVDDACRVLRPKGVVILGRIAAPEDGIDERLKERLDRLLDERLPERTPQRSNGRTAAARYLAARAGTATELVAARWCVRRTPRAFLERHAGGARFSRLPQAAREAALAALAGWAETEFGSLDTSFAETHRFEMQLFRFAPA